MKKLCILLFSLFATIGISSENIKLSFDKAGAVVGYVDTVFIYANDHYKIRLVTDSCEPITTSGHEYTLAYNTKNRTEFLVENNAENKDAILSTAYLAKALGEKLFVRLDPGTDSKGKVIKSWNVVQYVRLN